MRERSLALLMFLTVVSCSANAQITVPADVDGLTELTKPIAISGQTVFTSIPGGIGNATSHSYHRATNILQSNYVPLYFDVEFGRPNASYYFKETYRVMYVTSPDQVVKDGGAPIPTPLPPFMGNYGGTVYIVGICLNKNRSPNAPAVTPWMDMKDFKIYTQ